VADGVGVAVGTGVAVPVGIGVGVGLGGGVAVGRGVGVGVGRGVGVAVGRAVGVAVGRGVPVGAGVEVGPGVAEAVGLGVGVGAGPTVIVTVTTFDQATPSQMRYVNVSWPEKSLSALYLKLPSSCASRLPPDGLVTIWTLSLSPSASVSFPRRPGTGRLISTSGMALYASPGRLARRW
jgi:hypothetical protein